MMEFGYFTLSDNHYENNSRDANKFIADITAEAIYAHQLNPLCCVSSYHIAGHSVPLRGQCIHETNVQTTAEQ
jgi:hypothetical protein